MIVGIMQPYFFPYIGYFQLIAASDVFVFHDDVQYIKAGWINRNRIVQNGKVSWLTFPVVKAAHDRRINERYYRGDRETRMRLLRRVGAAYREAPRFQEIYPLVEEIIGFGQANVAAFNVHLIRRLAAALDIRTPCVLSSQLAKDDALAGQDRVIAICRCLGASGYVNPAGGRTLYQRDRFSRAGLELGFLEPAAFGQGDSACGRAAALSILDGLMREDAAAMAEALARYRIIAD